MASRKRPCTDLMAALLAERRLKGIAARRREDFFVHCFPSSCLAEGLHRRPNDGLLQASDITLSRDACRTLFILSYLLSRRTCLLMELEEHLHDEEACIICLERILRQAATWQCESCFCLIHLSCVRDWIAQRASTAKFSKALFPAVHSSWTCPKCRALNATAPEKYLCFCKKTDLSRELEPDLFREAHSCGEICGKSLMDCDHRCTLLCHSGPCPSCSRMNEASCFCGAHSEMRRCGLAHYSCEEKCGKTLPCGHQCESVCHPGECVCQLMSNRSCQCGKMDPRAMKCAAAPLLCKEPCGLLLDCQVHSCAKICHDPLVESCESCVRRKSCACGAVKYGAEVNCLADLPKCSNICHKPLQCGHECNVFCHDGECPPCEMLSSQQRQCQCGRTKKMMPCDIDFKCGSRCNRVKNCGRHKCSRKCCSGCNDCVEVCGQKLECGNHWCEEVCHSGPCKECPRLVTITCACTRTQIRIPCGSERNVSPPKCKQPCSYVVCHHKPNHACHYGTCPKQCDAVCKKPYGDCAHQCLRSCHDPVYPEQGFPTRPVFQMGAVFKTKAARILTRKVEKEFGPRIRLPVEKVSCEPCAMTVQRMCIGEHKEFDRVCSSDPVFACAAQCGNALRCGNHKCQLGCHVIGAGDDCKQCSLRCSFQFAHCLHACSLPCHPSTVKHPTCVLPIRKMCYCDLTEVKFECWETQDKEFVDKRLHCGKKCWKSKPCGHKCQQTCHKGACETGPCEKPVSVSCLCRKKRGKLPCVEMCAVRKAKGLAFDSTAVLDCDEACAEAARLKKLEEAREEESVVIVRKKKRDTGKKIEAPKKIALAPKATFFEKPENIALSAAVAAVVLILVYILMHRSPI